MYRASLTRFSRSALILREQSFHKMCMPQLSCSYINILQPVVSSTRIPRRYFCNSLVCQSDTFSIQSSLDAGNIQEKKLRDILAMDDALELLKAYKNYKDTDDMAHNNRITALRCIADIIQKDGPQRFSLKEDINRVSPGENGLFVELLDHILEHISESSSNGLASVIWSLGKIGSLVFGAEIHALVQACEQEILSRDITTFNAKAINQILAGLASFHLKRSKFFDEVQSAILAEKIKISDFENQGLVGSLWSFSQTGNGSCDLFELYLDEVYVRGMSSFKPFELFQLVFAFANKGIKADQKLFSHAEQEIVQMEIDSFSNMDIFLVLKSFANRKSDKSHEPVFMHMDREFAKHGVKKLSAFLLSNILWCFTKEGMYHAKVYDIVAEEILNRDLSAFHKYLPQLLWSFAVSEKEYPELYERIVSKFLSTNLRNFNDKDLCQYAWCFGKLGITNDSVYQTIEAEILSRDTSWQLKYLDVQKLLTGFAHAKKGSRELFEFFEAAVLQKNVSTLKASEICNVLWPFAEMGFKTAKLYDVVEEEILRRGRLHFKEGQLARLRTSFETFGHGSQELNNLLHRR